MTRVLLCVGGSVEKFLTSEMLADLADKTELEMRNGIEKDEQVYSTAIREAGAEIVITGWGSPLLTSTILGDNPQVKYMCHLTGGLRANVTREVIEDGFLVTNWGTLIGPTVAEAALLGILCCLRQTTMFTFMMHRDGGWRDHEKDVESLYGKPVGLHGFGNIARSLVGLLRPFGCEVSAFDPHVADSVFVEYGVRRVEDLETLYAKNRVISIHAPKIPETHHSVNSDILASMQDGASVVNTSRGSVIETQALVRELKSGRISASLDVYEEEPLPEDSPLRGLPNCHLTCHTAGPTPDRMVHIGHAALENVQRYINGGDVLHRVDLAQYDLMT